MSDDDILDYMGARLEQSLFCPRCNGTGICYYPDPGCEDECDYCQGTTIWEMEPDMQRYRYRILYRRAGLENWYVYVN